jgi:exopolysaccharide production protein ExoQ
VFLRLFERLFVFALLLYSMGVLTGLTLPHLAEDDVENVSTNLHVPIVAAQIALYTCAALLILMRWRRVFGAVRTVWPLLLLTALVPVSAAWSVLPAVTLRRSIVFVASTLIAVYLGERYTMDKFARMLAQTLCLMMLAVIALYFIAPVYVMDPSHKGAWKGLSGRKNAFGEYMAVAVALLLLVRFRHLKWLRFVFLGLSCCLLFLSHSATSLVACTLMVAAMPLWRLARLESKQRVPVYIVGAMIFIQVGYVFVQNIAFLLHMIGRDPTLTGRTQVWAMVLTAIQKRLIFGYGYDSFWTGLKGESLDILIGTGWLVPTAHNGFLELGLSLGLLGSCVFLYVFVQSFRRAIEYIRSEPGPLAFWPVTYFCFFLLHNMGESDLLTRCTLSFMAFVAINTSLALSRHSVPPSKVLSETPPAGERRTMDVFSLSTI